MVIRVSKDRIDMNDKVLQKPELKDFSETVVTANSGTSYTVDLTAGNVFNITLTGNCGLTFSNPPASGKAGNFILFLKQDSTGSRTVTWPGAVTWTSGIAPTLFEYPDSVNIFSFLTVDGGTTWFGTHAEGLEEYIPYYIGYGYFAVGASPIGTSVDRIDYANDTPTAVAKGPLSLTRTAPAAAGNSSYGYFGGGVNSPTSYTTNDRIDYANDTPTAVAKGPLSLARYYLASTGNSNFGYFGGGRTLPTIFSTTDRIDYANDAAVAIGKGSLSLARLLAGATGSSAYAYVAGGFVSPFTTHSIVDRIDYNNDTPAATVKGPLSAARYGIASTGNSSFGYFGGGAINTPFSSHTTVGRLDYNSDTVTAVAKGPLSLARYFLAGSGNSSYGYFGGGSTGSPAVSNSTIDRLDYANDTATATAKGPLSVNRASLAGANNGPA